MSYELANVFLDYIGVRRQNRIEFLFNGAQKSSHTSQWVTWITVLSKNTCYYCYKQRGKIFDMFNAPYDEIPVHPNCRCSFELLAVIKAGTATKDGLNGADWALLYNHVLPNYYIFKNDARKQGWIPNKGNLWEVLLGRYIYGGEFYNSEGILPQKEGRTYFECDIDYTGGYRNNSRIVFSNDGLIFVTYDHYRTFFEIGE